MDAFCRHPVFGTMKPGLTCVALRHLAFEDLGMFEELLVERGYRVHYLDVPLGLGDLDPLAPICSSF